MSQPINPQPFSPYEPKPIPPRQENGLGIAGFITSIIGLITCGSLSIFGVILSGIGLRKEPRGLAVAGLVIGLIGIVEMVAVILLMLTGISVSRSVATSFQQALSKTQLTQSAGQIGKRWEENGRLPSQEEGDQLLDGQTDMWGNDLEYETDGFTFSIRSAGEDQQLFTEDDVRVGPFEDAQSAIDSAFEEGLNDTLDMDGFQELEESMREINKELEDELNKAKESAEEVQQ